MDLPMKTIEGHGGEEDVLSCTGWHLEEIDMDLALARCGTGCGSMAVARLELRISLIGSRTRVLKDRSSTTYTIF